MKTTDTISTKSKIIKIIEKLVSMEDGNYSVGIILNRAGVEITRHTSDNVLLKQLEDYYKIHFGKINYESI